MAAAEGPAYVPTRLNDGAPANDGGGALGFLDRFFGADTRQAVAEKAHDARIIVAEKAQVARANLSVAGTSLVATAKAHPMLSILTLVGGIAAIGLLAHPATRRAAIAGGAALWSRYGRKAQDPLPKP